MRPFFAFLIGLAALGCGDDSNPATDEGAVAAAEPLMSVDPGAPSAGSEASSAGYDLATLEADHLWFCELITFHLNDRTRPIHARKAEAFRHLQSDPRGVRVSAYLDERVPDPTNVVGRHERVVATLREDGVEWSCPQLDEFRLRLQSGENDYDPSLGVAPDGEFGRICGVVEDLAKDDTVPALIRLERVHRQVWREVSHPRIRDAWDGLVTLGPTERYPSLVALARELGVPAFDCPKLSELLLAGGEARSGDPQDLTIPGSGGQQIQITPEMMQQLTQ